MKLKVLKQNILLIIWFYLQILFFIDKKIGKFYERILEMKSLENLISLFDSEKFFFMTTFLPVMLYKDFSETQKVSLLYILLRYLLL